VEQTLTSAPLLVVCTGPPGTGKSTLADEIGRRLGATVLGWDWAMGALTWCTPVQDALASLDRVTHRRVGWSLLWNLAQEQLRLGRSVVLDGVARAGEVAESRTLAQGLGARAVVVLTTCEDRELLRRRIEGRDRAIPGWDELTWEHVEDFLGRWEPPDDADITIDTGGDPDVAALVDRVVTFEPR
jgi:predicted kinase